MTQLLRYISAAADGTVLGIDPNGQILQAVLGPSWTTIPSTNITGTLKSIGIASDGTIWGISNPGSVWQFVPGTGWTNVTCTQPITKISVGSATAIWAVDAANNVYQYEPSSGFTSRGTGITSVSAASDGSVCGLNTSGIPQQYNAGSNTWTPLMGPFPVAFISLTAGTSGWIAAVGLSGKIYQYVPGNPTPWLPVQTAVTVKFKSVSAGDDTTIWALDESGNAYYYEMSEQDWVPFRKQGTNVLTQISVGDQAAVMGIDASGNIYQITTDGTVWRTIASSSTLAKLSVASANDVWALDNAGNVYENTGGLANWSPQSIRGGPLSAVSAAADGTVWGLAPGLTHGTYNVVRYLSATTGWEQIACPYQVVDISVGGAKTVMASDSSGNVYEYLGVEGWKVVPANDTKATGICVASDGAMWGVTPSGKACAYVGKTDGFYQIPNPIAIRQVAVGSSTNVWTIDINNSVTQLVNNAAMISEASVAPPRASLPGWDTENPFDEAQSTHLWIVNRAVQLASQTPNTGAQLLKLFPPFKGQIGNTGPDHGFHDRLCQGLYDADFLPKYNGPTAAGQPSWASHFYDPETGKNWLGSSSFTALTEGRKLFWKAIDYYVNGDWPNAGYYLGLSLHYLTDLTQPMHAANFTYLNSFMLGYHTAFEEYVMAMQTTVTPPATLPPSNLGSDPGAYFISAATNSKNRYYQAITPGSIYMLYNWFSGLTNGQRQQLKPNVAPILTDAITITAQYMLAWMALATSDITLCQFISSYSGNAMDITDGSTSSGAVVQQYHWNNTLAQGFRIVPLSNADQGYCNIIAQVSNLALDVQNQSKAPNALIIQNTLNSSSDSQKWQFIRTDGSTVSLVNKNSGLLVTAQQSSSQLVQGPKENSRIQQWQLTPAAPVYIKLSGSSLNVDSSRSPSLIAWNANTTAAQQFLLVPLGGNDIGYYMILAATNGEALWGASPQVILQQWVSSDGQKWMLVPQANQNYSIQNKASKQFLFVPQQSGQYQPGTLVTTSTQQVSWVLSPATALSDEEVLEEMPASAAAAATAG